MKRATEDQFDINLLHPALRASFVTWPEDAQIEDFSIFFGGDIEGVRRELLQMGLRSYQAQHSTENVGAHPQMPDQNDKRNSSKTGCSHRQRKPKQK